MCKTSIYVFAVTVSIFVRKTIAAVILWMNFRLTNNYNIKLNVEKIIHRYFYEYGSVSLTSRYF